MEYWSSASIIQSESILDGLVGIFLIKLLWTETWCCSMFPSSHTVNVVRFNFLIFFFRHFSFSIHLQKAKGVILFLSPAFYQYLDLKWLVDPLRLCMDSCSEFISIQYSEYIFYCIWDKNICISTFFHFILQGILNYQVILIFFLQNRTWGEEKGLHI